MTAGRWPLGLWTAVIVLVVVPWAAFEPHTHWQRVAWIPFVSPPVKLRDVVVNLLLYAPWGYFLVRAIPRLPGLWAAALVAGILSMATEAAQLYSHGRFPSATDVVCNIIGAYGGAAYARRKGIHADEAPAIDLN